MTTLELAFCRGLRGCTFATADELGTPGYSDAWAEGEEHRRFVDESNRRFRGSEYTTRGPSNDEERIGSGRYE